MTDLEAAPAVRVVIADDEAIVRHGLRLILDRAEGIEVVGEAADGAAAVDVCARVRPQVVLMDVRMPVLDGIEATRRITKGAAHVLILTTYDLDENLYLALRAGASGFLLKTSAPEDLVHAVRVVARGDALVEMARGRSTAEIAARFFVSEGTVKTHVGRVLAKLGVRDRVQAVVLAYRSGLVR